jgi:diguanylate cyclase (GGDEF)-like protein
MDLIGEPGSRELGFSLVLCGTMLLAAVFAIQTWVLSRRLRLREEQGRQLEELAFVDPLTRLPNRRLLLDRLQRSLYSAERFGNAAAVYFLDLDNFKAINDQFDHATGDLVLTGLATRWTREFRAADTVARWGGDEFVIVTEGISTADDINVVVQRLRAASAEPFLFDDKVITVNISVGVAVACRGTDNPEDLIRCADAAMYRAKRSGEAPGYEIVGQRHCIEAISGLASEQTRMPGHAADYVRVSA